MSGGGIGRRVSAAVAGAAAYNVPTAAGIWAGLRAVRVPSAQPAPGPA